MKTEKDDVLGEIDNAMHDVLVNDASAVVIMVEEDGVRVLSANVMVLDVLRVLTEATNTVAHQICDMLTKKDLQ